MGPAGAHLLGRLLRGAPPAAGGMNPMRWLIVTADDFGITSGINRGIIQAHRDGILTSTSLMVDRPACEQAAALGRACGTLSVGLHLELDPGKPECIHEELERQLARFFQLAGAR